MVFRLLIISKVIDFCIFTVSFIAISFFFAADEILFDDPVYFTGLLVVDPMSGVLHKNDLYGITFDLFLQLRSPEHDERILLSNYAEQFILKRGDLFIIAFIAADLPLPLVLTGTPAMLIPRMTRPGCLIIYICVR